MSDTFTRTRLTPACLPNKGLTVQELQDQLVKLIEQGKGNVQVRGVYSAGEDDPFMLRHLSQCEADPMRDWETLPGQQLILLHYK